MKIEPTADIRQAAAMMYQFYVAMVQAGFNQDQALELVKVQLTAAQPSGSGGGNDE